jgi:hypothetical protein
MIANPPQNHPVVGIPRYSMPPQATFLQEN